MQPKIDLKRGARRQPVIRRPVHLAEPPNSIEAEQGILGCLLWNPLELKQLTNSNAELFFDLRHAEIFMAMRELFRDGRVVEIVTVQQHLKDKKRLNECGGLAYLSSLQDAVPSAANLPYYLEICREKFALRRIREIALHYAGEIDQGAQATKDVKELADCFEIDINAAFKSAFRTDQKKVLEMWKPKALATLEVPTHLRLVGDNEIVKGYEGLALIGGPGSSGKSLVAMTLAIAGAKGEGMWMGRPVHRKFKTMFLQAENGAVRLKEEFQAVCRNHPELDLDEHILISAPPEGGLPFHKPQFRAAVREEAAKFKPDLVVIDTWAQVAADDAAKDIIEKIGEIRSCFPGGEDFPSILILAHTSKPRADVVRKGRGLINSISGSIALANTARCVYILLPWSDETEDQRIYWSCVKLNNGKMYPPTVWLRRFGTFFEHDEKTDPRLFGKADDEEDRHKLTEEHLRVALEKKASLKPSDLVAALVKVAGVGQATAYRAVMEDGHLRRFLMRDSFGKLKLKEA